jgi:leader peptidase (prepilin peptidase) / N-methyltransferase
VTVTSPLLLAVLLVVYLPPAVVLSWVDGREHRLPNRWVGALTGAVTTALLLLALLQPPLRPELRTAAILALVLGLGAILVALLAPGLLGMGDAKSLPVVVLMSAALGGEVLLAALLGIAVLGGVLGMVVIAVTRRAGVRFALGPVLLAGPFLGLLGAPAVRAALGTG